MKIAHVANTDYFCGFLLRDQLRILRDAGHEVHAVSGPGPLLDGLRAEGIAVHTVANARRIDPGQDLRTLLAYIRLFRREEFDLVHTHNPKVNVLASIAARAARVPRVVSTLHGLYSHDGQRAAVRKLWRGFESVGARCADLVLCQSAEDVRTARWSRIVPDENLRRLGNGVDLARFDPRRFGREDRLALRRRFGIAENERVIGFVGRLVREKGIEDLLEAARELPRTRLLLVGPDERGAKADGLDPTAFSAHASARWLGLRRDLPPIYATFDTFVLPSHREGFPRSLVESAAMGIPAVATDIRGCREVIAPGETGCLVPPHSPTELMCALRAMLRDPIRRASWGRAARRRAEAHFDERAVFERVHRAYAEMPLPSAARRWSWAASSP
ncbi:MAG: glycosyltransferase family 4 protein [Myxococcales bacterium]|nr:glycosyltransferase family 4 protein [Myxococcales bacterium]